MTDRPPADNKIAYRRIGSARDPRRILCDTKYFDAHYRPLARYLVRLNLSRSTERVFWLHWHVGVQRGDFTSEISVREVARHCYCCRRSVLYAYRKLQAVGLLRRQDPGRDPEYPHRQAVALTEVFLPESALGELLNAPDRPRGRAWQPLPVAPDAPPPAIAVQSDEKREEGERAAAQLRARHGNRVLSILLQRFSAVERQGWLRALRDAKAGRPFTFEPDAGTRLESVELTFIRHHLQGYVDEIRQWRRPQPAAAGPADRGSRRTRELDTVSRARLRHELSRLVSLQDLNLRFQEVVWSVERGALARFEVRHAINIALKKIREGLWSRPNGMPAL